MVQREVSATQEAFAQACVDAGPMEGAVGEVRQKDRGSPLPVLGSLPHRVYNDGVAAARVRVAVADYAERISGCLSPILSQPPRRDRHAAGKRVLALLEETVA